jgi:GNAT superfamily N-acetyltransferase
MIRKTIENDLLTICEISNEPGLSNTSKEGGIAYYDWYLDLLKLTDLFFTYEIDGKCIGFVFGEKLLCNGSILWGAGVLPEYQNKGIGVRLLKHYENKCKEFGITWIYLDGYIETVKPDKMKRLGYSTSNIKYKGYYKEIK